jgi:hypothetical protein
MNSGAFWELGGVTDLDLQAELTRLLASGSRTEARIIAHLATVEERRLHLEAGSSSLFDHCLHRLGLSETKPSIVLLPRGWRDDFRPFSAYSNNERFTSRRSACCATT